MSKVVEYILSLKDQFSPAIEQAKEKTKSFQQTITETKETAVNMFSSLGIAFGAFEAFQFIKESREEFEQMEQANAQLKAGLESTRGVAGLTFDGLEEGAKAAAHNIKFTQGQIEQMQSVLLTFPAITKQTFGEASQAIFDMATRLHQDLDQTAIQVGKALQDPIKGITALRRVGVNFNEAQTEMIKKMVETGKTARAQAFILHELQTEFAGSAAAAAHADPLFHYRKSMEDLRETIGELVIKLQEKLAPAFEAVAGAINDAIDGAKEVYGWFQRNKEIIGDVGIVLGTSTTAWIIYDLWSGKAAIGSAIRAGLFAIEAGVITALGTAVEAVNAAFIASPIGWIVTAVAGLTVGVIELYKHFGWFRGAVWGVWAVIKGFGQFLKDSFLQILKGVGEVIHGIFHLDFKEIQHGLADSLSGVSKLYTGYGFNVAKNFKQGYAEGIADFENGSEHANLTLFKPADTPGPPQKGDTGGGISNTSVNKVSGSRITTINVTINGGLAPHMSFHTTNLYETAGKIRDAVARALTSAVNDSQIIADH